MLLVYCGALLLGLAIGWFGCKANIRIHRWGEALTQLDRDVQVESPTTADPCAKPAVLNAIALDETVAETEFVDPMTTA